MRLTKSAVRIGAVIRKEMRELWRRPGALLSLALGPLVVMALFGIGFTGQRGPVDLIVVIPKDLELPRDAAMYQKVAGESAAHIVAVTDDANDARARLSRGEIRMILLAPADLRERIERGEQAQLIAETNELDPIQQGINAVVAETLTREVNAEIIKTAAQQGLARLASSGASPPPVAPDVVARPLRPVVRNNATADPTLLTFFTPAVLALVLQHLGITLTALSMVRERVTGAMDIFRVAPINAVELLVGKYVAYGILGLGASGRAAVDACAARLDVLQRVRPARPRVPRTGAGARLRPPGHLRDRDLPAGDAARAFAGDLDAGRARGDRRDPLLPLNAPTARRHARLDE